MPEMTLHELNQALFAQLLPDTHGLKKGKRPAGTQPQATAPATPYSAEQLQILTAAGINDPAAADPQTVAAILGLPPTTGA